MTHKSVKYWIIALKITQQEFNLIEYCNLIGAATIVANAQVVL